MNSPVLDCRKVSRRFGSLEILNGINLSLQPGEIVSIVGPSGTGKSTLLHIAGLMDRPTSGEVFINGQNTQHFQDKERAALRLNSIGFLFQFHYLLPDFNVLENVLMPARLAQDNLAEAEENAKELLNRLGLGERLHHTSDQLSGGEQQRVALGRALIRRPQLLLCDEPTGNLDQATSSQVIDLLWGELEKRQMATIIVTHNEDLARRTSKSYLLKEGILVEKRMEMKRNG